MKAKKVLLSLLLALSLALTACGGNKEKAGGEAGAQEKVLEGESTKGMAGKEKPLKVKVTVSGDKITKVEVTEHGETPGTADPALSDIPKAIVEKGSTEGITPVSGATLTSDAIVDAVNNALANK